MSGAAYPPKLAPVAALCVFCGKGPTTVEHVYAQWLRDALPIEGPTRFRTTDPEGRLLWEQRTFDIEAKVACGPCNHGWMSDLEALCGPLLTNAMLYGASLTLTPKEQRMVALWAIRSVGIITKDPPNDAKGYVATFAVGYAGFQIFGVNVKTGGLPRIWYGSWVSERTIPLWPNGRASLTWPPSLVMSTADMLLLADLWADASGRIGGRLAGLPPPR